MKNYLRSTALGLGLMFAGASAPALGQGVTPNFSPRYFGDQQTTYTRFSVNFNSCNVVVGTPCSFKVGAIPYNAFIVRGYTQTFTSFTGATTMTASLGTAVATPGNLVGATSILTAGNAAALTIAATGLGLGVNGTVGVTGNNAAPTGSNGGFDLWVTLTTTVAAPTAGSAVMILEYVLPNDGACTSVPTVPGATIGAPGC